MKKGFTLIELMIVVVIIGILTAIAIPNFYKLVDRAKAASVVSNMHTTQMTVETKAAEKTYLEYFPNIEGFVDALPQNFKNPYSNLSPAIQNAEETNIEGVVEYEGSFDFYRITGYGKNTDSTLLELTPATHLF
ncbi:MAG: prepilin-type N-terminal cleavage/methylation domain-containing protein [candidate division WOR-3 bacterium]